MTDMIESKDVDLALSQLIDALGPTVEHLGATAVTIKHPGDIATALPLGVSPAETLAMAVEWMGARRGTIASVVTHYALQHTLKPASRVPSITVRPFFPDGVEVQFHHTDSKATLRGGHEPSKLRMSVYAGNVALLIGPQGMQEHSGHQLLVTLGLVHSFISQAIGASQGFAGYLFDSMSCERLDTGHAASWGMLPSERPASPYNGGRLPDRLYNVDVSGGEAGVKRWLEDAAMLTTENMVVGVRSLWLRQVATPLVMAYRHMDKSPSKRKAAEAVKIASQCQDTALRVAHISWLKRRWSILDDDLTGVL